jgi:hypothetical protein
MSSLDDMYFYFKVPVIPRCALAHNVKESPCSWHNVKINRHPSNGFAIRQGGSLGATLEGDRLILARQASPKSDDVCFKKVRNKIYFKVPVIPPRLQAEVKGSPCSWHNVKIKCHPSNGFAIRQGVSLGATLL